jgi:dUTP pyrophosphatase
MAKHTKEAGKSAQVAALAKFAKKTTTVAQEVPVLGPQRTSEVESQQKTQQPLEVSATEIVPSPDEERGVIITSAHSAPPIEYFQEKVRELGLEATVATPRPDTLLVKKLDPRATLPTVNNPGEDLGYDIYAIETVRLSPGETTTIKTGIAAYQEGHGLLIRDRSSMAKAGLFIGGGVVDAGYRGELTVLLSNHRYDIYTVKAGDKVAQMLPLPVLTGRIVDVGDNSLPESARGVLGFGSSGR